MGFDFGVELTYPIGESFSTGLLMSSGQIFGIVYSLICSKELDNQIVSISQNSSKVVFLILSLACGIGFILTFLISMDLKRTNAGVS